MNTQDTLIDTHEIARLAHAKYSWVANRIYADASFPKSKGYKLSPKKKGGKIKLYDREEVEQYLGYFRHQTKDRRGRLLNAEQLGKLRFETFNSRAKVFVTGVQDIDQRLQDRLNARSILNLLPD